MPIDSATNRYTGSAFHITFNGVVLSTDFTEFGNDEKMDKVDITAGSEQDRSYIFTIRDRTMSLKVFAKGEAGTLVEQELYAGNSGTLVWSPKGTASLMPKYSCMAIIESVAEPVKFADAVALDISFQRNGAMIDDFKRSASVWS